jgi:hypothetical protein
VSDRWRICCTWLYYLVETQISEWSKREELVVGRSLDPLVVLIHMYKKRHAKKACYHLTTISFGGFAGHVALVSSSLVKLEVR